MNALPTLQVEALDVDAVGLPAVRPLLRDVAFTLPRRGVLGVVGESGSGKSVLARTLCNWVEAPLVARGSVRFDGREILNRPARAMRGIWGRRIAYIGADPGRCFDPTQPVGAQLIEKLRSVEPGVGHAEARRRVARLLEEVRIPDAGSRMRELPARFSSGMIQRAAIVDALVTDPDLLIADSITHALDVTVAAQIVKLLQALHERLQMAVLFFSPSLAVVRDMADDVLVLSNGRIVERGRIADVAAAHGLLQRPRVWAQDAPDESAQVPARVSGSAPLLSVDRLFKRYPLPGHPFARRAVQALRGVSFELWPGEALGIVGESGCGKSTLTRLLTALEAPDAGTITFDSRRLPGMTRAARLAQSQRMQLVLPDPFDSLPVHWSIGRIIAEPLRIHRALPRGAEREAVWAMLAEVGLPASWMERLPAGLSAGQRQRVALARALVLEPSLLILDETLSALAPADQRELEALLAHLRRTRRLTTILISHDLALVRRLCDRVLVMYLGRVVESGPNRPTFFDPLHPYTQDLLSAVPVLEPNPFPRARFLLDGETPSAIDLPPGCSYAGRCPAAFARCRAEERAWHRRGARGAACHLLASPPRQQGLRCPDAYRRSSVPPNPG